MKSPVRRVRRRELVISPMPLGVGHGSIQMMKRTILIVDDHPSFRRFARRLLEAEGFVVVGEASDGASAVAA